MAEAAEFLLEGVAGDRQCSQCGQVEVEDIRWKEIFFESVIYFVQFVRKTIDTFCCNVLQLLLNQAHMGGDSITDGQPCQGGEGGLRKEEGQNISPFIVSMFLKK